MRTLRSFLLDAYWSYDAIAEAEGFKRKEKRREQRGIPESKEKGCSDCKREKREEA